MSKYSPTEVNRLHLLELIKSDNLDRATILKNLLQLNDCIDGPYIPRDGIDRSKPSTKPKAVGFKSRFNQLELAVDMSNKSVKIWISPLCGKLSDLEKFGKPSIWKSQSKKGLKSAALKTVAPTLAMDNPAYILEQPTNLVGFIKWYCKAANSQATISNEELSGGTSSDVLEDKIFGLPDDEKSSSLDLDIDIESASKIEHPTEDMQLRAIKTRRGQSDFRKCLLKSYGNKCAVTGCEVLSVLEAAHINAHAEGTDWETDNGLPLRADIHTLFDLRLLSLTPDYRIQISDQLVGSIYEELHGKMIHLPSNENHYPSLEKLARHYEGFDKSCSK